MTRIPRVLPLLAAAFGASLSPPTASQAPAGDQRTFDVASYEGAANCSFNRILAGPAGTDFVVWADGRPYILGTIQIPPSQLVVGRMHDSGRANADRLFSYHGSGLRLTPIRWSREGIGLYVRVNEREQRLAIVGPDGGAPIAAGPLDSAWGRISLTAHSHGEISLLRDAAVVERARRIDGKAFIRGVATFGNGVDMVAVRHPDLELVRLSAAGAAPTGVNGGHTRLLEVFPDRRRYKEGIAYLGAPTRGERRHIPYQKPLLDQETGRMAGRFGFTRISLDDARELVGPVSRLQARLEAKGDRLLDVSKSGEVLFAVVLAPNGGRKLVRLSADGINERPLCSFPPAKAVHRTKVSYPPASAETLWRPRVRTFALARDGRETTAAGRPILMQYSLGGAAQRDVVLYFHGGPGASIADEAILAEVRWLLTAQRDVVAVEYSGSLGGGLGLSRGIAKRGISALERDVDAVAAWLDDQGYRRVYVLGGSFGGVPGLVAVSRHRNRIAGSFFVVPLLRLQHPDAWKDRGSGFRAVAPVTQLTYEYSYFGGSEGRARFARELETLVATAPLGPHDRFYFAELDPMSRPEHLPPGPSSRKVIPKIAHGAISASDSAWEDILAHLDGEPQSRGRTREAGRPPRARQRSPDPVIRQSEAAEGGPQEE